MSLPYVVMFVGVLAVSTAALFIRFAQVEVPSAVIAAYRLGLASLLLFPLFWRQRPRQARLDLRTWAWLGLSGLFLAAHFLLWITSLQYTTVASSVVLVTTTPLWVALFSALWLREPPTRGMTLGLALAFLGGVLMAVGDAQQAPPAGLQAGSLAGIPMTWVGDGLALAGAWAAAGYLLIGRHVRRRLPFTAYIFTVYTAAALVTWVVVLLWRLPVTGFSLQAYGWLLLLALIPQLVGHSSFNWAVRRLPATTVAATLLGEPVGASLLAAVFLGEIPAALTLVGGGVVLVGLYILLRATPRALTEEGA